MSALIPTLLAAPECAADGVAVYAFAPGVVRLVRRLLVPLSEAQTWRAPGSPCWFEILGGFEGVASPDARLLALSATADALTCISEDGSALTFERDGLRFPQLERAREADADAWRQLFVLYVGPFVCLSELLSAPGIERAPQTSDGRALELVTLGKSDAQTRALFEWLGEMRAAA